MENSERLGRLARAEFEPGISRLPVLSVITSPLVGLCIKDQQNYTKKIIHRFYDL